MKPLALCPHHCSLYVDDTEAHQVCSLCWEPETRRRIQRLVFPAAVVQHLRARGRLADRLPPHSPACPAQTDHRPLEILYPQRNARLRLARDFGGQAQQVVLRAAHADRDRTVYWYLDRHFLGATTNRHTRPAALDKGWHVLEIVDGRGHRDRTRFYASTSY